MQFPLSLKKVIGFFLILVAITPSLYVRFGSSNWKGPLLAIDPLFEVSESRPIGNGGMIYSLRPRSSEVVAERLDSTAREIDESKFYMSMKMNVPVQWRMREGGLQASIAADERSLAEVMSDRPMKLIPPSTLFGTSATESTPIIIQVRESKEPLKTSASTGHELGSGKDMLTALWKIPFLPRQNWVLFYLTTALFFAVGFRFKFRGTDTNVALVSGSFAKTAANVSLFLVYWFVAVNTSDNLCSSVDSAVVTCVVGAGFCLDDSKLFF